MKISHLDGFIIALWHRITPLEVHDYVQGRQLRDRSWKIGKTRTHALEESDVLSASYDLPR